MGSWCIPSARALILIPTTQTDGLLSKLNKMKKTLGGDRLRSGKKMQVHLKEYERSTHDKTRTFRTSMSIGTVVPCLTEVSLPGDTWDMAITAYVNTHPTLGPLFGSFQLAVDVFETEMKLYMAKLHNNPVGVGLHMGDIKFPIYTLIVENAWDNTLRNIDNSQINSSCILHYLGNTGIGRSTTADVIRNFWGLAWLIYWDAYKNYYANQQEEIGVVIHTPQPTPIETVSAVSLDGNPLPQAPIDEIQYTAPDSYIQIDFPVLPGQVPDLNTILFNLIDGRQLTALQIGYVINASDGQFILQYNFNTYGNIGIKNWEYGVTVLPIQLQKFNLDQIDAMRNYIMTQVNSGAPVSINNAFIEPWSLMLDDNQPAIKNSQEGLGLKCYKSDMLNNWLKTEWIEGPNSIAAQTAVQITDNKFSQDQFLFSKKLYEMLNDIAASGGTFNDWVDAVWTHDRYTSPEIPRFMGGLSQEIVFQEVISNSEAQPNTKGGSQPLGTLAGKGTLHGDRKGGNLTIKTNNPSVITAYTHITPRLDYFQGNAWHTMLETMDDLHKPPMDGIGFQDLPTEWMAWWDTYWDGTKWVMRSAGKQPAFIEWTTAINEVHGNFCDLDNEGWMVLTRRYEYNSDDLEIGDLTTYINPTKFNNIFAETKLDAQNFWVQIGFDITVRRKMSAKLMPH